MPEICPFRAVRYNPARTGSLDAVVAPPYDVISPEEARELERRSPYNVVRLILPARRVDPGDAAAYEAAARRWREWREQGVLLTDPRPAVYVSRQRYRGPRGGEGERLGFYALAELAEYGRGGVYRHEATKAAPKAHLWELLKRTRAAFSPVFGLFSDPAGGVGPILRSVMAREADTAYRAPEGGGEEIWRVEDPEVHAGLARVLRQTGVVIADGHHRYETRLRFSQAVGDRSGPPGAGFTLMYLADVAGGGVEVFPTHRLIRRGAGVSAEAVRRELERSYRLSEEPLPPEASGEGALLEGLQPGPGAAALAWYPGGDSLILAHPGAPAVETLRYLEERLFPALLAGGPEAALAYTHSAAEAITAVKDGRAEAAFLVPPVPACEVWERAVRGEVLPPKSTYFYPKLVSGLLMHDLELEVERAGGR